MVYRRLRVLKGYVDAALSPLMRLLGGWGVQPIHLTLLSLPCGLLGVWLLFSRPLLSAALVLAYFTLDFMDGTLARVTGQETEYGGRLDFAVDRLVAASFLVLLYLNTGELLLPAVGLTLIFAVSLEDAGLIKR